MKFVTPELVVEDVNATVAFYRDVLGFESVITVPEEGVLDWALLKKGSVQLMIEAKRSIIKELPAFKDVQIGGSLILYIDVDEVQKFYEQIKQHVEVVREPHGTFYGAREFAIRDINSYVLLFAERRAD